MKNKLLFGALMLSTLVNSQIYVDPTYTGTVKTGTITQPLTSLPAKPINNSTYLIKAGTTQTLDHNFVLIGKIDRYGAGENPMISFISDEGINIDGSICNVNVTTTLEKSNFCVKAKGLVRNVNTIGGQPGIFISGKLKIENCYISQHRYDAINTLSEIDSVWVVNTKIDNAYMGDGDCGLQMSSDNLHIENVENVFIDGLFSDHSQFLGKFAAIISGYKYVEIKNSTLIGVDKGTVFYVGYPSIETGAKVVIKNSIILGGGIGIFNDAHIECENVLFKNQTKFSMTQGGDKTIKNCTFLNIGKNNTEMGVNSACIISWWGQNIAVTNSIFDNCEAACFTNENAYSGSNNLYYNTFYRGRESVYSTANPNYVDTVYYKAANGLGAILSIPVPKYNHKLIKVNYVDSINKYKSIATELASINKTLSANNAALTTNNADLNNKINSQAQSINTLNASVSALSNDNVLLANKVANLESEKITLTNKITSLTTEVNTLKTTNTALTIKANTYDKLRTAIKELIK